MKTKKTKVMFRKLDGKIIALFPELPGDYSPVTCLSYTHTGQHGAAMAISPLGKPATLEESLDLLNELLDIGYDLRIVQRMTRKDYQAREYALLPERFKSL